VRIAKPGFNRRWSPGANVTPSRVTPAARERTPREDLRNRRRAHPRPPETDG